MLLREILNYLGVNLDGYGGGVVCGAEGVNGILYNLSLMVLVFSVCLAVFT
jgi:hypothetical protein